MSGKSLDFLTRFALTAILGSAAIILVAPFLRPDVLPPWLADPSRTLRAQPALAQLADRLADALLWSPTARKPAATPTPQTTPSAVSDASRWAIIVAADAPAYRPQGQFWQRLPPGTVMTVHGLREASVGPVALCRLPPPAPPGSGEFLVRRNQLEIYDGRLDAITPENLDRYQQVARLRGELEKLKAAPDRNRTDNPQWQTYDRARAAYTRHTDQARSLHKRFDAAVGDERMQLADEMRRLKSEEARLSHDLAVARRAYDAWNAANPSSPGAPSPQVLALESELASLSAKLPATARVP